MKLIITIILLASTLYAQEYHYLEVTETLVDPITTSASTFARISVTDKQDASNQLADVIATWFTGLTYTAVYHVHTHTLPNEPNKPCEVSPMKQGDTHKGTLETIVNEQHELPEMVVIPTATIEEADKAVKDAKKTKWFANKETKEKKE
jgi:hypothetical protein